MPPSLPLLMSGYGIKSFLFIFIASTSNDDMYYRLVTISMRAIQLNFRPMSLFTLVLFFSSTLTAQKKSSINYFNQKHPGHVAQIFARGILSTDALEHSSPAFSPNGKTVVWAVMKMPSYQICLLQMHFTNDQWSPAQIPAFSDTTANEVYPTFSNNGDTLYFSSNRRVVNSSYKNQTLWYVSKTAQGWSDAKPLDTAIFKKDIYAHSISKSGKRYFTVGPHRTIDWNIFTIDSQSKINPLPPPINSKGYEDGPFIAADESYLIFESDRPTGIEGNIDLYILFR
jgi:hypothetical protein